MSPDAMLEALKSMLAVVNDAIKEIELLQQQTLAEVREINAASLLRDSIEIGTPGKQGVAKCYVNAADPEDAKKRIDHMLFLRVYANVMGVQMWAESDGGTKLPAMPDSTDAIG
ncbi:MAG: hypothetical protein GXY82_09275 [Methanospirillum sp.]|nr:hypothetical protein [Methanospirillum sp.]